MIVTIITAGCALAAGGVIGYRAGWERGYRARWGRRALWHALFRAVNTAEAQAEAAKEKQPGGQQQ